MKRIAGLSAAVDKAAAGVLEAQASVNETATRHHDLRSTLANHDRVEPAPNPDLTDELSQMLAANPAAAASADWEGRLREAQDVTAAAITSWKGKRTIILQALDRVAGELTERREALTAAKNAHELAWAGFVNAGRDAMLAELEAQWPDFYASVMGPIDALNQARRLYSSEPVYSGPRRQVIGESLLAIGTPTAGGVALDAKLYPAPPSVDLSAIMAVFRSALAEAKPKR
ncbi:hypothetical protein ACWGNZ_00850 [Sphingomonas zeae]